MTAVLSDRLKLKQHQVDTWSVREQLCLASAVLRSGDQNWVTVSRTIRALTTENNRPSDWYSTKNCALQYAKLLEQVDTPKRKRERGDSNETPGEIVTKMLSKQRLEELRAKIKEGREMYDRLLYEIQQIECGQQDDNLDQLWEEMVKEQQEEEEREAKHQQWLREREEKIISIQQALKHQHSLKVSSLKNRGRQVSGSSSKHHGSLSETSSEMDSAVDSPDITDTVGEDEDSSNPTPSSPLLSSLLSRTSTPLTASTVTTAGPLSSVPSLISPAALAIPTVAVGQVLAGGTQSFSTSPAPMNASSDAFPNLFKSAISGTDISPLKSAVRKATPFSPNSGAPTLSRLLELPPNEPGQPLPNLFDMADPPAVQSAAKSEEPASCSSQDLLEQKDKMDGDGTIKNEPQESINIKTEGVAVEGAAVELEGKEKRTKNGSESAKGGSIHEKKIMPDRMEKEYEGLGRCSDKTSGSMEENNEETRSRTVNPERPEKDVKRKEEITDPAKQGDTKHMLKKENIRDDKTEEVKFDSLKSDSHLPKTESDSKDDIINIKMEDSYSNVIIGSDTDSTASKLEDERAIRKKRASDSDGKQSEEHGAKVIKKTRKIYDPDDDDDASQGSQDAKDSVGDYEFTNSPYSGKHKSSLADSASVASPGTFESAPNSPASLLFGDDAESEKSHRSWKKSIMILWSDIASHKYASIFLRPITDDRAPGYHSVVYRPMDLQTIKRNVESGTIRGTAEFQRDVLLMFLNAKMYNTEDHDVYQLSEQMLKDTISMFEEFHSAQMLARMTETPQKSFRRETRESIAKRSDEEQKRRRESDDKGSKKRRSAL